jgi:hypothetical protein
VGGTVLSEAGVNTSDTEVEAYYNDSYAITPKVVNQLRLILGRELHPATSVTDAPAIVVPGSFTGGGAQADRIQTEVHGIMNDTLSWSHGNHELRAGINVPDVSRRGLIDHTNIGGTYTFSTLADYASARPFSFIQQGGIHSMNFVEVVLGGFVQDEFRLRPNLLVLGRRALRLAELLSRQQQRLAAAGRRLGAGQETENGFARGRRLLLRSHRPARHLRSHPLRRAPPAAGRPNQSYLPRGARSGSAHQHYPPGPHGSHSLFGAVQRRGGAAARQGRDADAHLLGHARREPISIARCERAAAGLPRAPQPSL